MEYFIKLKYLKLYLNQTVACGMELRVAAGDRVYGEAN